jgi:site-specific recombinase XerD
MQTTKTIDEIINEFLGEKSVTTQSRKTFRFYLMNFFTWCSLQKKDKRALNTIDLTEYLNYVQVTYAEYYQRSLIITVKQFFFWMAKKGYYQNIALHLKVPKVRNSFRKDALNVTEIMLFQSVFQDKNIIGKRDTAICMLMLINGLRTVEVSRMDVDDIFKQNGDFCINIQRKGHTTKDDFISLRNSWEYIEDYIHELNKIEGPMFTSFGGSRIGERLSAYAIGQIITKYLVKAGIKSDRITPHSLRHTAAVLLIQNNFDIYHVQKHLGHSKTEITELYLKYADKNLKLKDEAGNFLSDYYKNVFKSKE